MHLVHGKPLQVNLLVNTHSDQLASSVVVQLRPRPCRVKPITNRQGSDGGALTMLNTLPNFFYVVPEVDYKNFPSKGNFDESCEIGPFLESLGT